MKALAKFMKKNKKLGEFLSSLGDKAGSAGKMGLGAASLGAKGAGKVIEKNPKKAAAAAAAAGVFGGYSAKGEKKKKKKRPYMDDDADD